MKTATRISSIIASISVLTICILTVLMHFRYHLTRMNLINDRINITSSGIFSIIDNNLRNGISIESQADMQNYIEKAKMQEDIIDDIYILKNNKWHLETVFKTSNTEPTKLVKEKGIQKIKSSRDPNWSFNDEQKENMLNYVGTTIKGPTGNEIGAILVSYKNSILVNQEKEEVQNLYKRMGIAIILCLFLSFMVGSKTTKTLSETIDSIEKALDDLKNKETVFDISKINDPSLRGNVRGVLNNFLQLNQDLNQMEELLSLEKKEQNHD